MTRIFISRKRGGYTDDAYSEIDTETGNMKSYRKDGELIYSVWKTNVIKEKHWDDVEQFIKNRLTSEWGYEEITEKEPAPTAIGTSSSD